jgi:hypothetical protein
LICKPTWGPPNTWVASRPRRRRIADCRTFPKAPSFREGVEDRVEFRVADAQNLPFDERLFDVALCESVATFIRDRQRVASGSPVPSHPPAGSTGFAGTGKAYSELSFARYCKQVPAGG